MIAFPNAKINLGLNVVSKRPDGYHNIQSCFYPVAWCDILEIIPADEFSFTTSGLVIPGSRHQNLCVKAYQLIEKEHDIGPVQLHLHKVIPMGAGLGGGSSDGTFTLKLLNDLFELQLSDETLRQYAAQLGSDCSFFVENRPTYVSGTGNVFHDIQINLKDYKICIIHPGDHVSTVEAYTGIKPKMPERSIDRIIEQHDIVQWKDNLINDFEISVVPRIPKITTIKNDLYTYGALYASMTGSGSAVYGIFDKNKVRAIHFKTI